MITVRPDCGRLDFSVDQERGGEHDADRRTGTPCGLAWLRTPTIPARGKLSARTKSAPEPKAAEEIVEVVTRRFEICLGAAIVLATGAGACAQASIPLTDEVSVQTGQDVEADQLWLASAERSCEAKDFASFFEAFARSLAVSSRYRAATVKRGEGDSRFSQSAAEYPSPPIMMIDNSWVTSGDLGTGVGDGTDVDVDIDDSDSRLIRVTWTPVRFEVEDDGESASLSPHPIGQPGVLAFEWMTNCWRLAEDVRPAT